ncbi:hypothetical protein B0O99DRAFT_520215 [Bisporella sp. PMI_857]|nr:hypothetical protein B0O99DRAFT_520215 [Bisporella sp. PMI_857]
MQFVNTLLLAATALASVAAAANTVQFINQDSTTRHIVFTSQEDIAADKIENLVIGGLETKNQTFPTGWIGNWYSYNEGQYHELGMLGEVRFDGWNGLVFFDVSAIVNSTDTEGVKILYPQGENPNYKSATVSGCQTDICTNRYNVWNDVATKATLNSNLVCLIGNLATTERKRGAKVYPRDYVLGKESS